MLLGMEPGTTFTFITHQTRRLPTAWLVLPTKQQAPDELADDR